MGLKVKLVKSFSSGSERQVATVQGLGLFRFNSERILKDTPAIRGMIDKVRHLVSCEVINEEPKPSQRRKPRKIRVRDAARVAAADTKQV